MQKYMRNQVWWVLWDSPKSEAGDSIQRGTRPVIIVSNDMGNCHSPVVLVVPCTSKDKTPLETHFTFYIGDVKNTALCEQILTVNKSDLTSYIGSLSKNEVDILNKCLMVSLQLDNISTKHKGEESSVIADSVVSSAVNGRIMRNNQQKQEIVSMYNAAVANNENLGILASKYGFSSIEMLKQSVKRWEN